MSDPRLPASYLQPGSSSFSDFLAQQAPDLLPGRRSVPQGNAADLAPHGTTIVAVAFPGGVLLAGDRRATMGNIIASRDIEKVFPTDEFSAAGIAGTAGLAVEMVRLFQTELEHYEKIEGTTLSLDGKANRLSALIRGNLGMAMQGLAVVPLFVGYDLDHAAGRIFSYDVTGGRYEETGCPVFEDPARAVRVVDALSTKRLLTTNWLDGTPMAEFAETATGGRQAVAVNMFRAWYVPLYFYGVIHGDPHPGNYTVREDGALNLLDFGCIRVFKPHFISGVIDLYHALRDDDTDLAVHAYESWGFETPGREMLEALNKWARYLYTPLLEDKVRRIQDTDNAYYGAAVAAEVHRELRRLGGIAPPKEFVLVDRAAIGLGSVFMRINAEVNWHRLFHELIDGFDAKVLVKRQKKALKTVGLEGV